MKRVIVFCMGLLSATMPFAQSPAAFKYQAVIRDATDDGGINHAEVTAVLVEAVKELKDENERLKAKLDQIRSGYENRLSALEIRIANSRTE